jgi:succinate-acetate transporter protein
LLTCISCREIAAGNTFGATALGSYGGFWISYGILLTPEWGITAPDGPYAGNVASVLGFFLTGWFIFTTVILLCTLRSTLAFFLLFFTLDLAFLFLACEQYAADLGNMTASLALQKTGGLFGFLAAFLAWYNALAGIQDSRLVYSTFYFTTTSIANNSAATPSSRFPSSTSPGLRPPVSAAPPSLSALRHKMFFFPLSNEEKLRGS